MTELGLQTLKVDLLNLKQYNLFNGSDKDKIC